MANRCAGLDPTWSHLPTPIPSRTAHATSHYHSSSGWLTPAAAFENEALTSALRASMSPAHAAASPFSSPATPSTSSTSSASDLLSGGHDDAPAHRSGPPPARALAAGPRGGRVAKRKPRPSHRSPTTYITADPANFRRMVQEITGLPVVASAGVQSAASEPASAALTWPAAMAACALPTLDTSAFLLDRTVAAPERPEDQSSSGGASSAAAVTAVEDEDSSVLQELEAMACAPALVSEFPTLESWGII